MSPTYIDRNTGQIIRMVGTPQKPMTRALYEEKVAEQWKLESMGAITLEHCLTACRFLKRERDDYIRVRFDGMPE